MPHGMLLILKCGFCYKFGDGFHKNALMSLVEFHQTLKKGIQRYRRSWEKGTGAKLPKLFEFNPGMRVFLVNAATDFIHS